ncbi:MAG: Xaa-Pro peptidase family protein [Gammaproteobacteria bacterium]|nr:Xaa-Pro peptidase family protein [Gammaproteobacteria bacterium]
MTQGVGGSTAEKELEKLQTQRDQATPISVEEFEQRLSLVREKMREARVDALYLDATTSLRYFTGMYCYASERLHGAIVFARGGLFYVCPAFEEQKTQDAMVIEGDFVLWEEHESPTDAVAQCVVSNSRSQQASISQPVLAIDHQTPFFTANRLQSAEAALTIVNAEEMIASCRRIKSSTELALLKQAKAITLQVHQSVAQILHEGIDTRDVQAFLDRAHIACGMDGPSTFKIVLFGEPTAYPHGVSYPQTLKEGDMVLIDTGATLHGYHSDITRSYVFGEPNPRQREIWELEQAAQKAAFQAAQIGAPCSAPDAAARKVIEAGGLGPGYQLPGLPHRTGHGVGMDVHEHPYIVKANDLALAAGMCFSIEPMICSYGEFGVRLEDHAYMTEEGARWFTEPSISIDHPLNGPS